MNGLGLVSCPDYWKGSGFSLMPRLLLEGVWVQSHAQTTGRGLGLVSCPDYYWKGSGFSLVPRLLEGVWA